jgi:hypothetical protein
MSVSDGGKKPLDKETFRKGLGMLEAAGLKNLDVNKDNTVDLPEFITGLSLLCKGTPEEKLERK